jgi:hypothetical protein
VIELGKKGPYVGRENKLQEAVINWLRYNGYYCFHVPNGGSRNEIEATNLKKQGVMAGCPDILIFDNIMDLPSMVIFKGIAIELKVKGRKVSDAQKEFMSNAEKRGFLVFLAWNLTDLIDYFEKNIRRL